MSDFSYIFDPNLQLHNRAVAPNLDDALEPVGEYFRDILDDERVTVSQQIRDELTTTVLFTTFNDEGSLLPLPLYGRNDVFAAISWRKHFEDTVRYLYGRWANEHIDVPDKARDATAKDMPLVLDLNVFLCANVTLPRTMHDTATLVLRELCRTLKYAERQVVELSYRIFDVDHSHGAVGVGACLRLGEATP